MARVPSGGAGAGQTSTAAQVGKLSRQQVLSPHSGARSTITGGDPIARIMGHYGKNPPPGFSGDTGMPGTTGVDPATRPGVTQIRGGSGGMKRNPRSGALGPGKMGTPGGSGDYSMNSQDIE